MSLIQNRVKVEAFARCPSVPFDSRSNNIIVYYYIPYLHLAINHIPYLLYNIQLKCYETYIK